MNNTEFFTALMGADTVSAVEAAINSFEESLGEEALWVPVGGRENNRGIIEVSSSPGRALIERVTNSIDAVLEAEHAAHAGIPGCRSPKEGAVAWLNVPSDGLGSLSPRERRRLAQRISITLFPGEGRESRIIDVTDSGIGLAPDEMPQTILSLNESNKVQKHYLAGTFGQGGSSTYATSKYSLIASRKGNSPIIAFTVVKYLDLPPAQFKTGHYVYLTILGSLIQAEGLEDILPTGTKCRHFGYDLTKFPSPLGPSSIYGLLQQVLFDPVLPVWFDDRVHDYRRVIKGSRNALSGAVDEGDEAARGPVLSHSTRMFYVNLGEFGRIGLEYWLLAAPERPNDRPIASYVDPRHPVVLTLNGQAQAEFTQALVRNEAELPYLAQRLICHVDCNSLTPRALRSLFVSTREDVRGGIVEEMIRQETIRALRSDDQLSRLNAEARDQLQRERDESASEEMRREVARLLRIQGYAVTATSGSVAGEGTGPDRPGVGRGRHGWATPIELHDPPTFIRIIGFGDGPITLFPEQRRYVRIETDAPSHYHNPASPRDSRVNIIVSGQGIAISGSTELQEGRMRVIIDATVQAQVGGTGALRVELTRAGLPMLGDERAIHIVEQPRARPARQRVTMPDFDVRAVSGPEDAMWGTLGWPESPGEVASSAIMSEGKLVVYYSEVFPRYAMSRRTFEQRDTTLANSFTARYKIWLAVHSLILRDDQGRRRSEDDEGARREAAQEVDEAHERRERSRFATVAALFAARDVQSPQVGQD